jgi:hypothetical protein
MPQKASHIWPMLHGVGSTACSVSQRVKIEGGNIRQGIGFEVGPQAAQRHPEERRRKRLADGD